MDKLSLARERELVALATKHGRQKAGKTVVEGVRAISTMLEAGVTPEYIVVCRENLTADGRKFEQSLVENNLPVFDCDSKRFAKLSDTIHSQGLLSVVRPDSRQLDDNTLKTARFILYLDGISDPGNVGTIVRTAAAFAVDLVAASPTSADFHNPKTIRASAGLVFRIPVLPVKDPQAFFERLFMAKIDIFGTAPEATSPMERTPLPQKLCLAIGSEATGLSPLTRQVCGGLFCIKTVKSVESLNAAAAAAIVIHQIATRLELI
jgi:RNA methyltransferase, TrmH family